MQQEHEPETTRKTENRLIFYRFQYFHFDIKILTLHYKCKNDTIESCIKQ